MKIDRREFIRKAAAVALLASMGARIGRAGPSMPFRPFGITGEKVSLLGIGGAHLNMGGISEADAIAVVRTSARPQGRGAKRLSLRHFVPGGARRRRLPLRAL
jgi:hypothetical protein